MLGSNAPKSWAPLGVLLLSAGRNPQGPGKHIMIRTNHQQHISDQTQKLSREDRGLIPKPTGTRLRMSSFIWVFFSVLFMASNPTWKQQHSMQSFWGNDPTSPAVLRNAPQVLQDQGTATEGGRRRAEELVMLRAAACSRLENEACWLVAAFYTKKPQVIYF